MKRRWFILVFVFCLLPFSGGFCQDTGEVTFEWDPNNPTPDGYNLYKRAEGESYNYNLPVASTIGSVTTCTVGNLPAGETNYFVVRAFVDTQDSGDSNEVTYTYSPPGDPGKITGVELDGSILSWVADANSVYYTVYATYLATGVVYKFPTTDTQKAVAPSGWVYEVTGTNSIGVEGVKSTPVPLLVPGIITGLELIGSVLYWDIDSNADSYVVYATHLDSGTVYTFPGIVENFKNVAPSGFTYQVSGKNSAGEEGPKSEVVPNLPPPVPDQIEGVFLNGGELSWDADDLADTYTVYATYLANGVTYKFTGITVLFKNVAPSGWTYQVSGVNVNGEGLKSVSVP
jgi:hypothetical protein